MTSKKALLSLLISVVLFAGFSVLAVTGLFDLVETRFYNPAVTKAVSRELNEDIETIGQFLEELQTRFAATLREDAVRRSFISTQSGEDITKRTQVYGTLLESLGGLQWVRFIDSAGSRIHFSTWQPDILHQDQTSIAYRNYTDPGNADYIPYRQIEASDQGEARLFLDQAGERILFSHPFYDSFDIYRGTAVFSLSVRTVIERMVLRGRIKVGEDVSVVYEPPGMVIGLPYVGRDSLIRLISRMWGENSLSLDRLNSSLTETSLALISEKTIQGIFVGLLVNESLLSFPLVMRIILLASFFITVYLIIFLLLNIRQDTMTVVQNRLKWLQINLIEAYYEHKGDLDLSYWRKELEQRKDDVFSELKRGIKTKDSTELDVFIDEAWEDLLSVIGGRTERKAGIDEENHTDGLNRLPSGVPGREGTETGGGIDAAEEVPEELEELTEIAEEVPPEEAPDPETAEEVPLEEFLDPETIKKAPPGEDLEPETVEELPPEEAPDPAAAEEVPLEEFLDPGTIEKAPPGEAPEPKTVEELPPDEAQILETAEEVPLEEFLDPETAPEEPQVLEDIDPLEVPQEFLHVDPLEFEDPTENPDERMNDPASEIEFSPVPEDAEKENETGVEIMGEDFEIQSPFTSIFSSLSEVQFEPDPAENLESLEKEGSAGDDSPEAEVERLDTDHVEPLFVRSFSTAIHEQIELLEIQDEEETGNGDDSEAPGDGNAIISERDGVSYINRNVLTPDQGTVKNLDTNFKNLIDSVLNNG